MKPLHIVFLLLINVIWGCNFVAMSMAVDAFPPIFSNAVRFGSVLLILLPFLRWAPGKMPLLLANAFLMGFVHFCFALWAVKLAGDVSIVAVATQLNVPFSAVLAILVLRETVGWKRVVGIALSFAGVAVISFDERVFGYIFAVSLAVGAAFIYSVSTVLTRQLSGVPALTVQAWIAVAGVTGSIPVSLMFETGQIEALGNAGLRGWGGVLYSGILSTIIGHGGVTWLLGRYEVAVVSPYFLTAPVFAVLASIVILGESLTMMMVLGACMTFTGVAVVTLRSIKRSKVVDPCSGPTAS